MCEVGIKVLILNFEKVGLGANYINIKFWLAHQKFYCTSDMIVIKIVNKYLKIPVNNLRCKNSSN